MGSCFHARFFMFFNFTARYIASERAGIILPIYVIVKKSHFAIGYYFNNKTAKRLTSSKRFFY
jgi:hypothetical protein